jgi:hypothetical protein
MAKLEERPLITLTNLLQEHRDPKAKVIRDFIEKHGKDDPVFTRRARIMTKLKHISNQRHIALALQRKRKRSRH